MSRSGNNDIDNISGSQQESTGLLVATSASSALNATEINIDEQHNLNSEVQNLTNEATIVDAAPQSLLPSTEKTNNIVGRSVNDASQEDNSDDIIRNTLDNLSIDSSNHRFPSTAEPIKNQDSRSLTSLIDDLKQTVSGKYLTEELSSAVFPKQLKTKGFAMSATMTTTTSLSASTAMRQTKPVATSTYSWRLNSGLMERTVLKKDNSSLDTSTASSLSATTSPSMLRKGSLNSGGAGAGGGSLPRRVSFPKSDSELVTGYLEPANPWQNASTVKSISEIAELYITSCQKHQTLPLPSVLEHLKAIDIQNELRQPSLSLKSVKLTPSDCEALEEIFKRIQYKSIDLSDCELDETAASALFEMIEYYEATNELDISLNACGMTHRGWVSCNYMIGHSQELHVLNAHSNPISKINAENLGNALSTSNLHTLKLEHCGLRGQALTNLCFKLRHNRVLKELWLGHNDLDCNDADNLAELLKFNHYLVLIDISNNNIRNEGLRLIVMALIMQSKELERRNTFQRCAAIDDEDSISISPTETVQPSVAANLMAPDQNEKIDRENLNENKVGRVEAETDDDNDEDDDSENDNNNDDSDVKKEGEVAESKAEMVNSNTTDPPLNCPSEKTKGIDNNVPNLTNSNLYDCKQEEPPVIVNLSIGSNWDIPTVDDNDIEDDSEDTVRSSTMKNSLQCTGGQSMLDKLLSMNSESSSDEQISNNSTDTLAAYCSEDTSLISDDIFDVTTSTSVCVTVTTITTTATSTYIASSASTIKPLLSTSTNGLASSVISDAISKPSISSSLTDADNHILNSQPSDVPAIGIFQINNGHSSSLNILENVQSNNNNTNGGTENICRNEITNDMQFFGSNKETTEKILMTDAIHQQTSIPKRLQQESLCQKETIIDNVDREEQDEIMSLGLELHHQSQQDTQHSILKTTDLNRNMKLCEDFDDTHSTDSAFESASEGDISRHLPDEFSRLSVSLESTRLDDIAKGLVIDTGTCVFDSSECLLLGAPLKCSGIPPVTISTPPISAYKELGTEHDLLSEDYSSNICCINNSNLPKISHSCPQASNTLVEGFVTTLPALTPCQNKIPKVTIIPDGLLPLKYKVTNDSHNNLGLGSGHTPPPPSTSPGGASSELHRTESSCAFLTQSSRNCSQSTDSLCSDNSLDGSIGSGDLNFSITSQLNEKLTKNDTLTRQQRPLDASIEQSNRLPSGLKALSVWNNNLTKDSSGYIADLLSETSSLELLNIGKNCLSNEFIFNIQSSLTKNTTLHTFGLQSAHLSAKGIEALSSMLTFGGNSTLQRIDIRDNKLELESLNALANMLKSNTTITQIDIDDEPKRLLEGNESNLDYVRVLENVRSMCSRNEKTQSQIQAEKLSLNTKNGKKKAGLGGLNSGSGGLTGGYYMGSRKISLTCHSRPVITNDSKDSANTSQQESQNKLDVKRKQGTRLRSPVPSPPTISPSSSPNRTSRFQVFRVAEVNAFDSSSTSNLGTSKALSNSTVDIPTIATDNLDAAVGSCPSLLSSSLPTSRSLPSMATISSSTQSIKRLPPLTRSRFHVSKIYEDPKVPLAKRTMPPISTAIVNDNTSLILSKDKNRVSPTKDVKVMEIKSLSAKNTPILQIGIGGTANTIDSSKIGLKVSNAPDTFAEMEESTSKNIEDNQKKDMALPSTENGLQSPSPSVQSILSSASSSSSSSTASASSLSSSSSVSSSSATSLMDAYSSSTSTSLCSSSINSSSISNSPVENEVTLCGDGLKRHFNSNKSLVTASGNGGHCPLAIFSDNDITLTKNTIQDTASVIKIDADMCVEDEKSDQKNFKNRLSDPPANSQQDQHQQQHSQRNRKISWITNPSAVDKLLTLFHNPTTIFQRSSSPETTKSQQQQNLPSNQEISGKNDDSEKENNQIDNVDEVQTQKHTEVDELENNYSSQIKITSDEENIDGSRNNSITASSATNNYGDNNSINEEKDSSIAATSTISFLNAASKQIRDFSKQVFRQNATTSISAPTIPGEEIQETFDENVLAETTSNIPNTMESEEILLSSYEKKDVMDVCKIPTESATNAKIVIMKCETTNEDVVGADVIAAKSEGHRIDVEQETVTSVSANDFALISESIVDKDRKNVTGSECESTKVKGETK